MSLTRCVVIAMALSLGLFIAGCDLFSSPETPPLRLTSEHTEAGWNYATDGEVVAACPTTWTLEMVNRPSRAWRCRHHATVDGVAGCGLTVYRARGADTLEKLRDRIQPEIEGYGSAMEVISSGPSELGGLDAYEIEVTQTIEGSDYHGWYRMTRREDLAWLGHCIIPVDSVEEDRETVDAIFERISL